MKEKQVDFVKRKLKEEGQISRNECLRNYITRLGAIVYDLNRYEGFNLEGIWVKTQYGKDYVYREKI